MFSRRKTELLSDDDLIKEAIDIVSKASEKGIILRILGAVAVRIHSSHSPEALELYERVSRIDCSKSQFTDLDLIGYSSQKKQIAEFFEKALGFRIYPQVKVLLGGRRFIYNHSKDYYSVDIFFDKLEYSHTIYFGEKPNTAKSRLELDFPTITLTDLVLEKLQIHDIAMKDIIDLIILFTSHEVSEDEEKEKINGKYVATILADDWGFWYDATNNLKLVEEYAARLINEKTITKSQTFLMNNIERMKLLIDNQPKTKNWEKRARIGTSKEWYRKVETL